MNAHVLKFVCQWKPPCDIRIGTRGKIFKKGTLLAVYRHRVHELQFVLDESEPFTIVKRDDYVNMLIRQHCMTDKAATKLAREIFLPIFPKNVAIEYIAGNIPPPLHSQPETKQTKQAV